MKRLAEMIERLSSAHVLVIGDPITDRYSFGEATRLSQEAPVPIFVAYKKQDRPGGALNVAAQVDALEARVRMVLPEKPWSVKHRYLVGHQQIFRQDRDVEHPPFTLEGMDDHLDWAHVVVLTDYGKGCLSHAFCQELIAAAKKRWKHVIVDPRGGDWNKYAGATVIVPNQAELEAHRASFAPQPVFPFILEKLGQSGMRLMGEGGRFGKGRELWKSAAAARQVFDVTGAGDTVIATFAAAVALPHHDLRGAAELANLAAGVVVGKVGTSTCSKHELHQEIEHGSGSETEGEARPAGAPRDIGCGHGEEALSLERHRDPVFAEGGGAAAGGEACQPGKEG